MAMHGENSTKTNKLKSSLLATLDHLSKWMAAAVVGGVMAWRGDSAGMWAALGALVNWGLSVCLKTLIGQPRPFPAKKSDPGMPSSHSQSLFYGFTFLTLSVAEFTRSNHVSYIVGGLAIYLSSYLVACPFRCIPRLKLPDGYPERRIYPFNEAARRIVLHQSWLRVTQQYHTQNQVVVGALLGSLFCILWMYAWTLLVSHLFRSSLWIRVVVVLGAASFWMVLLKITVSTFGRNKRNICDTKKTVA